MPMYDPAAVQLQLSEQNAELRCGGVELQNTLQGGSPGLAVGLV